MEEKATVLSVDYAKAVSLDKKIKANYQIANEALYEMCVNLKEMKDSKLFKELDYIDFEDYCIAELGVKRRQAYSYISIAQNLSKDFVQSTAQIGVQKFALLARLDEVTRAELMDKTDLENTSARDLERQVRELKDQNSKLETDKKQLETERDDSTKKVKSLESKVTSLENQVEELESRPVEVAVADNTEQLDELREQLANLDDDWVEKYNKLQDDTSKTVIEIKQKHVAEVDTLISDYEKTIADYKAKLEEAENSTQTVTVTDTKELFKARLEVAIDSGKRLIDFIRKHDEELYRAKATEFFNSMIKELNNE